MRKCVSIHWESMFTRSMMQTADMAEQHALLDKVAGLVDAGKIRTTVAEHFGTINAANLKRAHALLETGKAPRQDRAGGVLINSSPARAARSGCLIGSTDRESAVSLSAAAPEQCLAADYVFAE